MITSRYFPQSMSAKKKGRTVVSPPSLSSGRFSSNWLALQTTLSEKLGEENREKSEVAGRRKRAADKGETARKRSKPSGQEA